LFYFCIFVGYIMGLLSKVIRMQGGLHTPWYVWFFYILNTCMVAAGIVIWFRNMSLEKKDKT